MYFVVLSFAYKNMQDNITIRTVMSHFVSFRSLAHSEILLFIVIIHNSNHNVCDTNKMMMIR